MKQFDNTINEDALASEIHNLIQGLGQLCLAAFGTPWPLFLLEYALAKQNQAFLNSDISVYFDEEKRKTAIENELGDSKLSPDQAEIYAMRFSLVRAILYHTVKAHIAESVDSAWANVVAANRFVGEFNGHVGAMNKMADKKTAHAKKAASARYAEDRDFKLHVFRFLNENHQKYANSIERVESITREVPVDESVAKAWYRSWKKQFGVK